MSYLIVIIPLTIFLMYRLLKKQRCAACLGPRHNIRVCPKFPAYKLQCSKSNYHSYGIQQAERLGYCAAGICPIDYTGKTILMIREERNGARLLNFIGGKRDYFDEIPEQTAMREFEEEAGREFNIKTLDNGIWLAQSKYVLFVTAISDHYEHVKKSENLTLVPFNDLRNKSLFHPYATSMINELARYIDADK